MGALNLIHLRGAMSILSLLLVLTSVLSAGLACDHDDDDFHARRRVFPAKPFYPYAPRWLHYNDPRYYDRPQHYLPSSVYDDLAAAEPEVRTKQWIGDDVTSDDDVEDREDAESRKFLLKKFGLKLATGGLLAGMSTPLALGAVGLGGTKLLNAIIFRNRFSNNERWQNPWNGVSISNLPAPYIKNPDFPNLLTTFESCTAPTGETGICAPGAACVLFAGRPSGSCIFGEVCCINTVTKCGGTVTLNNTYWQSPINPVNSPSTCAVTVQLDPKNIVEQPKPICQIRLDLITFGIAQPNAESICNTDSFTVDGMSNKVPAICGDNNGQHMYLNVPYSVNSVANINLGFNFGATTTVSRSWNIKISLLPCGASYLAPSDCLQYFTSTSGTVTSFNWRDVSSTATRQLANQDYHICFRTELTGGKQSTSVCFSTCAVTNAATAFSISQANSAVTGLSGTSVAGQSQNIASNCNNDFLVIEGGFNPAIATSVPTNALDRYCGEQLNPIAAQTASVSVCTVAKPYSILYRTNGDETTTATVDGPAGANVRGNLGFCLNFQQK